MQQHPSIAKLGAVAPAEVYSLESLDKRTLSRVGEK